jgi:hypothetical protein
MERVTMTGQTATKEIGSEHYYLSHGVILNLLQNLIAVIAPDVPILQVPTFAVAPF